MADGKMGTVVSMIRAYYSSTISDFLATTPEEVLGRLTQNSEFPVEPTQRDAWSEEIDILKLALASHQGAVYLEYAIPRMGKRIDAVAIIGPAIFVLEFKVGAQHFAAHAIDQVWDYALDLSNFHETSHRRLIAPILIATAAESSPLAIRETTHGDGVIAPIEATGSTLAGTIANVLTLSQGPAIPPSQWEQGRYQPTPTIVEAATALYRGHAVSEISRSDASAVNLRATSQAVAEIIKNSRKNNRKSICFVTGVPGSGKTLVGLNIANSHIDKDNELYSVFLSGNGPLVAILREALARDKVKQEREHDHRVRKGDVMREVKLFVQNVHDFRDEGLRDKENPPLEHVALFDEAQRAWNVRQTAKFMRQKRHLPGFEQSEPEFLISCMDRHPDWAVVVCLVGGGQEINTGEAGIGAWFECLERAFPEWYVHVSPRLTDSEYASPETLAAQRPSSHMVFDELLHLGVSMRSFRAENVSLLVKQLLDLDIEGARGTLKSVRRSYPIVITRSLPRAKQWLREQARGSERYGIVVSSQGERLKPHAIDVKSPVDPVHWFLDGKEDVRSSYYLEDVVTEFDVQGLEVDWACVTWDADFRRGDTGWEHWSFVGDHWNHIRRPERQVYLKNAYRVLLTRARQGMVIVVPEGAPEDPTRKSAFYDPTYAYLENVGFAEI